jgi:hypothetical protein
MDYSLSNLNLVDLAMKLKLPLLDVCSKDKLPKTRVGSYIVNLENSTGGGTHWVLVKVFPGKEAIYFDSFGLSPPEEIVRFVKHFAMNNREIQDYSASTCGYFCLACDYYLEHAKRRNVYERFDDFLNLFVADTKKNDAILFQYLQSIGLKL